MNELYEDIDIRKRRHDRERKIQRVLSKVTAAGAILESNGVRLIVFHVEVLLAAPSAEGWDLHLGCLTIFPPQPDREGGYVLPHPILLHLCDYVIAEDSIQFFAQNGDKMVFSPITDVVNEGKFMMFFTEFSQHMILRTAVFQKLADIRTKLKRSRSSGL